MNGREFADTNVLIYAFDRTAGNKRDAAASLLARLWSERAGCLSLQALQEMSPQPRS
jgi:predicted nucleic acid-binding protein